MRASEARLVAHQRGDVMAALQREVDDVSAGTARGSDDEEVHFPSRPRGVLSCDRKRSRVQSPA